MAGFENYFSSQDIRSYPLLSEMCPSIFSLWTWVIVIANLGCQLNVLEERENPNWRTASIRLACCVWGHFPNWQLTDEGLAYCRQCQRCTPGPGLYKKVVEQASKQNSSVALRYLLQAVALIFCAVFLDDGL